MKLKKINLKNIIAGLFVSALMIFNLFAGDYDFGRENNKRDAAERRTSDAGMQEGTIECAR